MFNKFIAAATLAAVLLGGATVSQAQNAREAEIIGFHQLCDKGDRKACVRFGMMLQQNHDMHEGWRKTHPEFFWWEH